MKKKDILEAIVRKKEERILPTFWHIAPYVTSYAGYKTREYYHNPKVKLESQLLFQEHYPKAMLFPGIWADFGVVVEASAMGSPIRWFDNDPPHAEPFIEGIQGIHKLKTIDPRKDGLMPEALSQYEYLWKHLHKDYIDEYGYLDGCAFTMGPIELGAMCFDFTRFLLSLYENPAMIHKLLDIVTENVIIWLRAQEKINGKLKRIFMVDHLPTQISAPHFKEFCSPYFSRITTAFPDAMILYHNEGEIFRHIGSIVDCNFHIFHHALPLTETMREAGEDLILMGNIDPLKDLLSKEEGVVYEKTKRLIADCRELKRGLLLSSGGGMAPGTDKSKIEEIFKSLEKEGAIDNK